MLQTLNMELEPVRTVLKNEVCEVSVCTDQMGSSEVFYTDVAVYQPELRRELARELADGALFEGNADFIGSFTFRDGFHLVFAYHPENRLCGREEEYCSNFASRKKLAMSLLAACAQAGASGGVGELVLDKANINISQSGEVYFNYFLDFSHLRPADGTDFLRAAGMRVYDILSGGYRIEFDGDIERYPRQLQLFYRKAQARGYTSLSQLMAFVRGLPDEPEENYTGARRILRRLKQLWGFILGHSTEAFLCLLVLVTLIYATVQIVSRVRAGREKESIGFYSGISQIGEVYLGDEDL